MWRYLAKIANPINLEIKWFPISIGCSFPSASNSCEVINDFRSCMTRVIMCQPSNLFGVSLRSGVASYGALGHMRPLLSFQQEFFFEALNNLNVSFRRCTL
jgi:hypothetical protein